MAILCTDDPGPEHPCRVLVAGTSGVGKTTLAQRLAGALAIPHVEIDALFHGPGWQQREAFADDVDAFTRSAKWVTEWQYGAVRELLADRADLMVWLDLPRATVMRQVVRRTVRRRRRRQVLWNGNVEPPLRTIFSDREHIVRWAWNTHPETAVRMNEVSRRRPDLPIVRLTSHGEADRWMARCVRVGSGPGQRG